MHHCDSDCTWNVLKDSSKSSLYTPPYLQDAYDSYVSYLLDSQKPSQRRLLYKHMESLSQDDNTSEQLKREQERVRDLEKKAKQMLEENER